MVNNMTEKNPCLKFGCSECCKPVKMRKGFKQHVGDKIKDLPFDERGEIWIPENHPDTVKIETYNCRLHDEKTGKCLDYENRPEICRNTTCAAFDTNDKNEQRQAIEDAKKEKFIICKK